MFPRWQKIVLGISGILLITMPIILYFNVSHLVSEMQGGLSYYELQPAIQDVAATACSLVLALVISLVFLAEKSGSGAGSGWKRVTELAHAIARRVRGFLGVLASIVPGWLPSAVIMTGLTIIVVIAITPKVDFSVTELCILITMIMEFWSVLSFISWCIGEGLGKNRTVTALPSVDCQKHS